MSRCEQFRCELCRLQPACFFTNLVLYLGTNFIILNKVVFLIAKLLTNFRSALKARSKYHEIGCS